MAFHVEFGINDTPLTQALEKGNYATAERLILDCPNSSFLDDGCYQRIPLYICLCGVDQYHERVIIRNLHLARLLIEHGANVNKRVPVTNFGSEYISPGQSALELLVDFYIDLTKQKASSSNVSQWQVCNPTNELVVGLNREYLPNRDVIKDDVITLIFDILMHGGDPNIQNEHRHTLLHRVAHRCADATLLCILHTHGGSLTQCDTAENTPLLSLCSVDQWSDDDDDDEEEDVEEYDDGEISTSLYNLATDMKKSERKKSRGEEVFDLRLAKLRIHKEPLKYLIKAVETDVNHQNAFGQTALFHAIVREDISAAHILLEAGACPYLPAYVWKSRRKKRKLCPLFASLMSLPLQQCIRNSSLYDRMVKQVQPISSLVDAGYFDTAEVVRDLCDLIISDFPEFSHLCPMADSLLKLMFGYKTASLKQLAARKLFQYCLLENTACLHRILPVSAILESYPPSSSASTSLSTSTSSVPPQYPSSTSPESPSTLLLPSQSLTGTSPLSPSSPSLPSKQSDQDSPSSLCGVPSSNSISQLVPSSSTFTTASVLPNQSSLPMISPNQSSLPLISPNQSKPSPTLANLLRSKPGKLEEYLTLVLNCTVLRQVTHLLQLPKTLLPSLEAHLLFLHMMLKISPLTARRPQTSLTAVSYLGNDNIVPRIGAHGGDIARFVPGGGIFLLGSGSDDEQLSSSDDSSSFSSDDNVEGDSDLEYW